MRKLRGNGEKLTLYIPQFSLHFLPLSPFPLSLSISYIKMHHILLQNVKYGTFVANVTKISTYAYLIIVADAVSVNFFWLV